MLTAIKIDELSPQQRLIYDTVPNDRYMVVADIEAALKRCGEHFSHTSLHRQLQYLRKAGFIDGHEKRNCAPGWYYRRNDPTVKRRPALVSTTVERLPVQEPALITPKHEKFSEAWFDAEIEAAFRYATTLEALKAHVTARDDGAVATAARVSELESEVGRLKAELQGVEEFRAAMRKFTG